MRRLLSIGVVFVLAVLVQSGVDGANPGDGKFVQSFLHSHCARCHNATDREGDFVLDDVGPDVAARRRDYGAILERLRAGDMPPEDEPHPDAAAARRVVQWIESGLAAHPAGAAGFDVPPRPVDGNRLPHAVLFGGPPGPTVPPPPRLWRLSPSGYHSLLSAVRVHSPRQFSQPFDLPSDPGIRDYAALVSIDAVAVDQLVRNAEEIVERLTIHKLVPGDSPQGKYAWPYPAQRPLSDEELEVLKGGVRVAAIGGALVRQFIPLLHPDIAPNRQELETAIHTMFGLALAREATRDEIESLTSLYRRIADQADGPTAAKMMLTAVLLTPEALYRFEIGQGDEVRPGVRMLSPNEIAFAVSLALAHRREPGLFAAATEGKLTTVAEVQEHVRRILDDPEFAKPRLLGFFREYFGYGRAADVFKDELPDYIHNPYQLIDDTDLLVLTILEKDSDVLRELLTTPRSLVQGAEQVPDASKDAEASGLLNSQTHRIWPYKLVVRTEKPVDPKARGRAGAETAYGFSEWPSNQPVELPGDRIGILMQPSWLVAWSENFDNDPVRRGRWVRERLLGGRVPDLPIDVQAEIPEDPHRTLRDRLSATRAAACWKCHRTMNDLGLPFEAFDHFGRPRVSEQVVDLEATQAAMKKVYRGAPLDTTGLIDASGDPALDGPVTGAAEMLRRLADSVRVRQVFIRHVFRYYMGRNETPGDAATLQEADRVYVESGGSFRELLVSLLTSESFLYRTVPDPSVATQRAEGANE